MPAHRDDGTPDSLKDVVYARLKRQIVSGELPPGSRLIERALVKQFGVSRTPIREALRMLMMEGWLHPTPRGAIVAGLSLRDIDEIFQIRVPLEDMAIQLAFPKVDAAVLGQLEQILIGLRRATAEQDLSRFVDLDIDIHLTIIGLTGNQRLADVIRNFTDNVRRYGEASIVHPGRVYESLAEHERFFEALAQRDLYAARMALQGHLWNTYRLVREFVIREGGRDLRPRTTGPGDSIGQ